MNVKKKLLNVGGNSKHIQLPGMYDDWEKVLLDIDQSVKPDICCDAMKLTSLSKGGYDVVYCSHNLEHYHPHEIPTVLKGVSHVLNPEGALDIHVPDIGELMRIVVKDEMDIHDFLYQSAAGPITVHDVIFGYHKELEESSNNYFAHKTGFTIKSLEQTLRANGFSHVYLGTGNLAIRAVAFLDSPTESFRNFYEIS